MPLRVWYLRVRVPCGKTQPTVYPWQALVTKDYSLTAIVIEQGHTILGHFSAQKTSDYIQWWYWWPQITQEVDKYCDSCTICQANKSNTQRPVGLLHLLPIPNHPILLEGEGVKGQWLLLYLLIYNVAVYLLYKPGTGCGRFSRSLPPPYTRVKPIDNWASSDQGDYKI